MLSNASSPKKMSIAQLWCRAAPHKDTGTGYFCGSLLPHILIAFGSTHVTATILTVAYFLNEKSIKKEQLNLTTLEVYILFYRL